MQIILTEPEERRWFASFLPPFLQGEMTEAQLLYGAVEEQSGTAVGAMLIEVEEDTAHMQWICVADGWRRQGIASRLVSTLLEDAAEADALHRIRALLSGSNGSAAALLRGCGFHLQPSVYDEYLFVLSDLQEDPFWSSPVRCSGTIQPLGTVPQQAVQAFNKRILQGDKLRGIDPIRTGEYDSTLSLCCMEEGQIVGAALAAPRGSMLELCWLYADTAHPRAAAALLQQICGVALRLYPEQTGVYLTAISPEAERIVHKLLPRAERRSGWIAWCRTQKG